MKGKELMELGATIERGFDPSACGCNNSTNIVENAFRKEVKLLEENIIEKAFKVARKTKQKSDLEFARLMEDTFGNLIYRYLPAGFLGLGYALGQMLDLTDPDALKAVKTIQKEIREKGLLPYVPREKKAGVLPLSERR